ncbi:MAG: NAD(P)/FAD-dependent oxidoreductase [Deltaproteobacteria bacterium]|nr:NAD(P)/FAD-dependent oxidoreductase [Deltaproteobacteria bacterium]
MTTKRAVVVGAGPAGSLAALSLMETNLFEVTLIDRTTLPKTKPCGGGLGPSALNHLRMIGLEPKIMAEAYPIRGARFHTPKGRQVVLGGNAVAAAVLPRERLDLVLAREAERAGARLVEEWPVTGVLTDEQTVTGVSGPKGEMEADLVVVAAGGTTSLAGGTFSRLQCIWQQIEGANYLPGTIEMVITKKIAPWYAWLFPEGQGRANIGMCCIAGHLDRNGLQETFDQICDEQLAPALAGTTRGPRRFMGIRTSRWPRLANRPHLWVAGEAAALTNEATGEGIGQAMISGRLVGQAAAHWDDRGEEGARKLYERTIRRTLGPGLGSSILIEHFAASPALEATPRLAKGPTSALLSKFVTRALAS